MRRRLAVAFMSLFLFSLGCASTREPVRESLKQETAPVAATTEGIPVVEIPEPDFNFGDVSDGKDYLHAFVIKNTGTGTLVIKKVQPG